MLPQLKILRTTTRPAGLNIPLSRSSIRFEPPIISGYEQQQGALGDWQARTDDMKEPRIHKQGAGSPVGPPDHFAQYEDGLVQGCAIELRLCCVIVPPSIFEIEETPC